MHKCVPYSLNSKVEEPASPSSTSGQCGNSIFISNLEMHSFHPEWLIHGCQQLCFEGKTEWLYLCHYLLLHGDRVNAGELMSFNEGCPATVGHRPLSELLLTPWSSHRAHLKCFVCAPHLDKHIKV